MRDLIKFLALGFGAAIFALGSLYWFAFRDWGKFYHKKDLINNYNQRSSQISEVKRYVNSITPVGDTIDIEFKNDNELKTFRLNESYQSDLTIGSHKSDSLFKVLGWTNQTLKTLKSKLDDANCTSVSNIKPFEIGYQQNGPGMYFYRIFDKPLTDSLKKEYDDGCYFSFYKNNVVLEYMGGAIGMQCFEDFKSKNN